MQLPKSHTPHKVTKKKPISKESQQVNVNRSTSQREIELSRFRDFERAEAIVLTSLTS